MRGMRYVDIGQLIVSDTKIQEFKNTQKNYNKKIQKCGMAGARGANMRGMRYAGRDLGVRRSTPTSTE